MPSPRASIQERGGTRPALAFVLVASSRRSADALPAATRPGQHRAASAAPGAKPGAPVELVTPSLLLPDVIGTKAVGRPEEGGAHRVLVDRMRVIARDDGSPRARARAPAERHRALGRAFPTRFGGGFLFHAMSGGSIHVWRAPSWLAKLEPLAEIGYAVDSISPGLDRLIVKLSSGAVRAIDPTTGASVPVAPLPTASGYGSSSSPTAGAASPRSTSASLLATFDAGAAAVSSASAGMLGIGLVSGNPDRPVSGGSYVVDERGGVTFRATTSTEAMPDVAEPAVPPLGPLGRGRSALRWRTAGPARPRPQSSRAAARSSRSRTGRSSRPTKTRVSRASSELSRGAPRRRVRLVCRERDGATAIMKPALRFKPRFVTASGNGALVVRGACVDDAPPVPDARPLLHPRGERRDREVRLKVTSASSASWPRRSPRRRARPAARRRRRSAHPPR